MQFGHKPVAERTSSRLPPRAVCLEKLDAEGDDLRIQTDSLSSIDLEVPKNAGMIEWASFLRSFPHLLRSIAGVYLNGQDGK